MKLTKGTKVKTRNGNAARILCDDWKNDSQHPLVVLVTEGDNEWLDGYTEDGKLQDVTEERDTDLVLDRIETLEDSCPRGFSYGKEVCVVDDDETFSFLVMKKFRDMIEVEIKDGIDSKFKMTITNRQAMMLAQWIKAEL